MTLRPPAPPWNPRSGRGTGAAVGAVGEDRGPTERVASTGSISSAEWTVQGFGVPCRWRHQGQRRWRGSRARRQVRARAVERVLVVVCHERGSGVSTTLMSANSVGSLIRIVSEAASVKGPGCEGIFLVRPDLRDALSGEEGLQGVESPESRPESHEGHQCELGAMMAPGVPESLVMAELSCWICLKELQRLRTRIVCSESQPFLFCSKALSTQSTHGGERLVDRKRLMRNPRVRIYRQFGTLGFQIGVL